VKALQSRLANPFNVDQLPQSPKGVGNQVVTGSRFTAQAKGEIRSVPIAS
jgi:hypothetical protein